MKLKTAFKLSALTAALSVSGFASAVTVNAHHVNGSGIADPAEKQYVDLGSKVNSWEVVGGDSQSQGIKGALRYDIDGKSYYQITVVGNEEPKLYIRSEVEGQQFELLTGEALEIANAAIKDKNPNFGGVTESTLKVEKQDSVTKLVNQNKIEYGVKEEQRSAGDVKGGLFDTNKKLVEDLDGVIPTTAPQVIAQKNVELGILEFNKVDANGNAVKEEQYAVRASTIDADGKVNSSYLTANGIETTGTIKINNKNVATEEFAAAEDVKNLASANEYTDTKAVETLASANEYTDTKAVETLASANEYTDTKAVETLASANEYTDTKAVETLAFANEYTDTKAVETLASANEYTDTKAVETLASANVYTDTKAVETLTSANVYTDVTVQLLRDGATAESARLDQAVVTSQETSRYYTDTKATETLTAAQDFAKAEDAKTLEAAKAEDVKVLASANAYTDAQIGAFGSTAARLNKRINDVEETAYRGIAIALAAQQQIPNIGAGQFAVFGGVGHYEGESAGALGLAGVLADGRTSLSAALGAAGNGEVGGRVGVAYVFGGK